MIRTAAILNPYRLLRPSLRGESLVDWRGGRQGGRDAGEARHRGGQPDLARHHDRRRRSGGAFHVDGRYSTASADNHDVALLFARVRLSMDSPGRHMQKVTGCGLHNVSATRA
jgi:hypothetical protein